MPSVQYRINIYQYKSGNLTLITPVLDPYPLDKSGTILTFTKQLSEFGQCRFRVSAYDNLLTQYGDILQPHQYHVQILRNGSVVWHGAIIENTKRTSKYIEVLAAEYEWYLSKVLINRSSADPLGTGPYTGVSTFSMSGTTATLTYKQPSNANPLVNGTVNLAGFTPAGINGFWPITSVGSNTLNCTITGGPFTASTKGNVTFSDSIYRIFKTGTMATAVTNVINETITALKHSSILGGMTIGTITNPNYPANMTDPVTGASVSGPWNFTTDIQLQFDFQTVLYCMQQMAVYAQCDFYVDNNLVFNFIPFHGRNKQNSVHFYFYQKSGQAQNNIVDYNLSRLGQQTVNNLYGLAVDSNGQYLSANLTNLASEQAYGLLEGVAAYSDIKNGGILNARIDAELPLIDTPTEKIVTLTLNETAAYPLGLWDIGDIVYISVQNKGVSFAQPRRVVAASVQLNDTGREYTTVQTNIVQDWQFPLATANGT